IFLGVGRGVEALEDDHTGTNRRNPMERVTEAPALTPEQLTALLEAEVSYQVARAELAAAEQRRYAAVWSAYQAVNRDLPALLSQVPNTINRATLAGAVRRHAPA